MPVFVIRDFVPGKTMSNSNCSNGRHRLCVEEISHLDIELTGSSHVFYQRHLDCVSRDYHAGGHPYIRYTIRTLLFEIASWNQHRFTSHYSGPTRAACIPSFPESMMDTDKLPLVDVECCATGSLSRGTAAAKKLGWRKQRDEGTS